MKKTGSKTTTLSRVLILVLTLMLALSAFGCANTNQETEASAPEAAAPQAASPEASAPAESTAQEKNRLDEIKERGYIEVVTEPYFAPYEFIDASKSGDEQYVGMDIEIAKFIAEKLEVELKIVPLEFSALLAAMGDGKYDLALSALAYSPLRAESMNMSEGYYFSDDGEGYGLLVREEDAAKYTDAASLKDAVVVTQAGSVQEGFVNEQIPEMKDLKLVSSMTDGFLMVSEGKADACACDVGNGRLYGEANGGVVIVDSFRFTYDESTEGTRAAMPKGEDELTAFVNECIAELREAGSVDAWYDEYAEYAKSLGIDF